jgi:hypothetical protein
MAASGHSRRENNCDSKIVTDISVAAGMMYVDGSERDVGCI